MKICARINLFIGARMAYGQRDKMFSSSPALSSKCGLDLEGGVRSCKAKEMIGYKKKT